MSMGVSSRFRFSWRAQAAATLRARPSSLGLSGIEMDGFNFPLFEIGHVFSGNLEGVALPDGAHRAFGMRAPCAVGRGIEQNRARRERPVGIEDHPDLRDIGVAFRR